MALSRRTGHRFQASIWPGFVDAMTGLLLVLMFVLTIFMVVQFVLRETITGQENELNLLSAEIAAIAEALGLEQEKVSALKGEVGALTSTLSDTQTELMAQANLIDQLTFQRDSTQQQLVSAQAKITSFEAQVAGLLKTQSEKTAQIADLEGEKSLLMSQQEALNLALATARSEIDKSVEEARRKAAERDALEALIASLKNENSDQKSFLNQQSADLEALQQRLSAEEEARLLEAAAAQALRKKLENADAELTAMSLALEEQRRAAEETLTMLAAAEAAQELVAARLQDSVLALRAAQLQLADRDQDIQRLQSQVADGAAELDQTEVALAAALARQLLLEDQIAACSAKGRSWKYKNALYRKRRPSKRMRLNACKLRWRTAKKVERKAKIINPARLSWQRPYRRSSAPPWLPLRRQKMRARFCKQRSMRPQKSLRRPRIRRQIKRQIKPPRRPLKSHRLQKSRRLKRQKPALKKT
jgi:chemotaxis protein MotB